jgi:hypothetical protein
MTRTVISKMRQSRQLLQTNDKLFLPLFASLLLPFPPALQCPNRAFSLFGCSFPR